MNRGALIAVCMAAATGWSAHAKADLVTNGGFEDSTPFNGWTLSGSAIVLDTTFPNSGLNDAAFLETSDDPVSTLSQTLSTVAGQSYALSFALLDSTGFFLDTFTVTLGGFSETFSGSDVGPGAYNGETIVVPGADIAGNDVLSFQGIADISVNFANPSVWNLDDVSVEAPPVPEPSTVAPFAAALALGLLFFRAPRRAKLRM